MIAWVLHVLELIAGIFRVSVWLSRLPDAAAGLEIFTPTAVGLVGLLAFVRHFVFHESDAKRLGWESSRPQFQYEVGFANLAFALVAFLVYFGGGGQLLPTLRWSLATACISCRRRSSTPGSPYAEEADCAACFRAPYPR